MSTSWPEPAARPARDRAFFVFNAVVSSAALAFLYYLLVVRAHGAGGALDLRFLPAVNASFNGLSAALLVVGYVAMRKGGDRERAKKTHQRAMVGAFASSSLFLVCYVAYHFAHGHTKFAGSGALRGVYLAVLASHVLLSTVVVPGALAALWFAATKRFQRHRRVTRWLFPVWLYVSVTGVAIFAMNQLAR